MKERVSSLLGFTLLVTTLMVPLWAQQNIDPRVLAYADMVFYNGKILTADDQFTIVEAVAIRDGKFLARGTTSDILGLAGSNTRRIDVQGKTVIPGLIDSHSHGWEGQLLKEGPDGKIIFSTFQSGLEQLRRALEGAPPGKLMQFLSPRNKYSMSVTRWELDKVAPHNPVVLSFSTYEYNLNSLSLKMFLDHIKTQDFPGLIKDPQTGEPNGMLRGLASGTFGYEVLPWPDLNELRPIELARMKRNSREGVTTLIGRGPGASITLVRDIWAKGELPVRVRMTHEFLRDNPEPERFLKRFGNLSGLGDDWFRIIGTLTQQPDGGSAAGAILTSQPKLRPGPKDAFGSFGQNRWAEHSNAAFRSCSRPDCRLLKTIVPMGPRLRSCPSQPWEWESRKPGTTVFPRKSMRRVLGPAKGRISEVVPRARNLPSRTARAWTIVKSSSAVRIFPL